MGELNNHNAERNDFIHALLAIYHNEHVRPTDNEAHKLADFITSAIATDETLVRNEFGLNKVVMAMKATCLAVQEIGLRGHALTAYMLRAVVRTNEQCSVVERFFGKDRKSVV